MLEDENVTGAVLEFSQIKKKLVKRWILRACLNAGVDFMERMSNVRLFQTVGPVKEKGLCQKVFLNVDSTQRVKLSDEERS